MKKRYFLQMATVVIFAITIMVGSSFISLQHPVMHAGFNQYMGRDTFPKTEFETRRLDEAINYLDERMKDFNKEWTEVTGKRIQQQINSAMAQVDFSKVQAQAMEAIKKTDWDKINRDIDAATANINRAAIDEKVKEALLAARRVDKEKIRSQVDAAMRHINVDAIKSQMENVKRKLQDQKINLGQHLKDLSPGINNELMKTRGQLQRLKDASLQMQRDGLIDSGLDNKIQYINNKLFINGVQQPDKISERYRHYFIQDTPSVTKVCTTVVV